MWWIIIIAVVAFIIYTINKEHKEHVVSNITNFGGMERKYSTVLYYLKSSGFTIQKLTTESVILSSKSMHWTLDYIGYNLEVRIKGNVPLLGSISKKWIFPDGYPQEKMIEEFDNYFNWQMEQLIKRSQNNPFEHFDV